MAATSKNELLSITQSEFTKLFNTLEQFAPADAARKREEDTSIKDVIAHRAHWIGLYLSWYKDGVAGKSVYFPAKGYKWNQLKEYNRELRVQHQELSWEDAKKRLKLAHRKLIKFLDSHSNQDLYGGPMKGARNDWTAGRWAEAAGASHYRSARKYARQCLKEE